MSSRNAVFLVALAVLVVLAGCSGAGGGGDAGEPLSADATGAGGGDAAGAGDGGGEGGSDGDRGGDGADSVESQAFQARERAVIHTGTVEMEVEDFDSAREEMVRMTRQRGGWVATSGETNHRRDNRTWTSGRLVLRVPSEEFSATVEDVKALGTVENAETDSQDVTDRLVDLEARLENLRAQRDRLRTLFEQANETEDVLRVEERLSDVQGEIERLEAKKQSLEGRVAYSTITVEYHEPRPEPPTPTPEPAYHEVGLVAAFLSSVDGVVVTLQTLAVTVAYVLPYVAVIGLPLLAGVAYATRRRGLW